VCWEVGEKRPGESNASTGSLHFPEMTACGWTGAFPIIPKFWNRRNFGANAIIGGGSAKKPEQKNPDLKFGRGEWE
jgi:hypothetical protein